MKLIKTSNNSEYFVCTNPVAENVINALSRHLMTINEYQVLSAGKKSKAELTQIMENRSWFLTTGDADVLEF
ncbi:MAG: hypothetical protein HYW34_03680 [Candidatus Brennerbacteria bacterium]|nr:hypothetical protein [Candidatus Brennerbacteria bacterium]